MRVALIFPPQPGLPSGAVLPSLAMAQLAAMARRRGHEVLLRDATASGVSSKALLNEVAEFQPDMLGVTATTATIRSAGAFAVTARRALPECLIVVGGPHPSAVPRSTLEAEPAFDCAVIGEGEETLLELLSRLPARDFSGVSGLAWRDGSQVRVERRRPPLHDLNSLPLPWWEGYPGYPEAYRRVPGRRKPASYLVTSRGCQHGCAFCDRGVFGSTAAFFSADYILRAVDDMVRRYGIRDISFEDDLFTAYLPRLRRVCEGLIERQHGVIWRCVVRMEGLDKEMFRLMKEAGCREVVVEVDSADARVLALAQRRESPARIAQIVKAAHRGKLRVTGAFTLGLPGEDEMSIQRSIDFALDMPFDDVTLKFLVLCPGAEIGDRAEEWGGVSTDVDPGCGAPVFVPRGMTAERLRERRAEFYRRFYLRPRHLGRLLNRFVQSPRAAVRAMRA